MIWLDASIVFRRNLGRTVLLGLQVPPSVQNSFAVPGQYIFLKVGDAVGPFAPASPPGESGPLEVLIKQGTPLTDALSRLVVGSTLAVSAAQGSGFPLQSAAGKNLLLVATGTGQAPMRSLVGWIQQHRAQFGAITLLLGLTNAEHVAFEDEYAKWTKSGIDVQLTFSQPQADWGGMRGRVQSHLPERLSTDTAVILVGQPSMTREIAAELIHRGLPKESILLNT